MKKRSKILALALVIILALSLTVLVACNNNEGNGGGPTITDKLPNLSILYEGGNDMKNTYTMIAVNPAAPFRDSVTGELLPSDSVKINTAGTDALIKYMSLPVTRALIASFNAEFYGEQLFYLLDKSEGAQYLSEGTWNDGTVPQATAETKTIRLSTTTSVDNSGLLPYILEKFESKFGYEVEVVAKGTGAALDSARFGNADLVLVHSKSSEEAFVSGENGGFARIVEGFDSERISFLYNFFVLVGPTADPANVKTAATPKDAFAAIASSSSKFYSRGDKSGTHNAELKLWAADLGITADGAPESLTWYNHTGKGMGECLIMANEQNGYVLSDKGTYLSYKKHVEK